MKKDLIKINRAKDLIPKLIYLGLKRKRLATTKVKIRVEIIIKESISKLGRMFKRTSFTGDSFKDWT